MNKWAPVPIVIAVFQALLLLTQWVIFTQITDHETRLRTTEAGVGRSWTMQEHWSYESRVNGTLEAMRHDLVAIKVRLGIEEIRRK
jgi:hypothetical protein